MTEDEVLSEAERLLADGSPQGAERVLLQAWPQMTAAPPDALHVLASVRAAQAKRDEAEALLRRAIAAQPTSLRHHIALGHLLSSVGNYADAAPAYADALNIDDRWPGLLEVSAIACYRSGRYADAERSARLGLSRKPNSVLWDTLSCTLRAQGRYKEALEAADQGLALESASNALRHSRAAALLRLERYQEALDIFDSLAAQGVAAAALSLYRGEALLGLNRTREAGDVFAEGLGRWPMSVGLQRAYANVNRR
jgi:tetratricopeptide (TPR) repeat protein